MAALNVESLLEGFDPTLLWRATPAIATFVLIVGVWLFLRSRRKSARRPDAGFRYQMATLGLFIAAILVLVLFLPMTGERRGQLLSFFGVLLSAMLALSSTSILGNALAGFTLRAQRSFRPGDFLQVGEFFGRVSERGLFHTEIQNEERDLTSLPNMYLANRPITVMRSTGTLVSATVSLGYDVPRKKVKHVLSEGARAAGLQEPFVRVLELGDFSVVYRVSGLLEEVKQIVSTRSRLNARVLEALHDAGVEIVSPTFMNQRVLPLDQVFIPEAADEFSEPSYKAAERLMFDKAEVAGSLEELRDLLVRTEEKCEALQGRAAASTEPREREELEAQLQRQRERAEWLVRYIDQRSDGEKP